MVCPQPERMEPGILLSGSSTAKQHRSPWFILAGAFLAVLVFSIFMVSLSFAVAGFKSTEEFGSWMTNYYLKPEPEKTASAIEYFSDSSLYKSNATLPTAAFFSALFKKDSVLMKKTFNEVETGGSENAKIMIINVLSLTHTPEAKELLERVRETWKSERFQGLVARQLARPHEDLYSVAVRSPQVLDMLWGAFFATGEDVPVKRVISVIHLEQDGHGEERVIGGTANWSLGSNAKQHRRVLEICREEAKKAQGATKELLEKIIKEAE